MHEDEVDIDAALVRALLDEQFPELASSPIEPVASNGTVNAIFRLGPDLCVRLPRVARWGRDLSKEARWLPQLAPQLSLAVPEPVAVGEPGAGYPFPWAIFRWIDGETYETDRVDDERRAAVDLAQFVTELRRIDITGAPRSGRSPLADLDELTRGAIASLPDSMDRDAITAAWERGRDAPAWDGEAVWRHCDLLPPNLLVAAGRLAAVIDFGGVGVGDSAHDVIAAWSVFGATGRATFRHALDVDDATWERARGVALHQALLIIPYYPDTNPAFVTMAERTVGHVLEDLSS